MRTNPEMIDRLLEVLLKFQPLPPSDEIRRIGDVAVENFLRFSRWKQFSNLPHFIITLNKCASNAPADDDGQPRQHMISLIASLLKTTSADPGQQYQSGMEHTSKLYSNSDFLKVMYAVCSDEGWINMTRVMSHLDAATSFNILIASTDVAERKARSSQSALDALYRLAKKAIGVADEYQPSNQISQSQKEFVTKILPIFRIDRIRSNQILHMWLEKFTSSSKLISLVDFAETAKSDFLDLIMQAAVSALMKAIQTTNNDAEVLSVMNFLLRHHFVVDAQIIKQFQSIIVQRIIDSKSDTLAPAICKALTKGALSLVNREWVIWALNCASVDLNKRCQLTARPYFMSPGSAGFDQILELMMFAVRFESEADPAIQNVVKKMSENMSHFFTHAPNNQENLVNVLPRLVEMVKCKSEVVSRLIRLRMEHIQRTKLAAGEPRTNNQLPEIIISRAWPQKFQDFARGNLKQAKISGVFNSINDARRAATEWQRTGHFQCVSSGSGKHATVYATKTLQHLAQQQQQYDHAMMEMRKLEGWLARFASLKPSLATAARQSNPSQQATSQSTSQSILTAEIAAKMAAEALQKQAMSSTKIAQASTSSTSSSTQPSLFQLSETSILSTAAEAAAAGKAAAAAMATVEASFQFAPSAFALGSEQTLQLAASASSEATASETSVASDLKSSAVLAETGFGDSLLPQKRKATDADVIEIDDEQD